MIKVEMTSGEELHIAVDKIEAIYFEKDKAIRVQVGIATFNVRSSMPELLAAIEASKPKPLIQRIKEKLCFTILKKNKSKQP